MLRGCVGVRYRAVGSRSPFCPFGDACVQTREVKFHQQQVLDANSKLGEEKNNIVVLERQLQVSATSLS